MLPMQLLRVRTRKGAIIPLFCTSDEELHLAEDVIKEFQASAAKKEKKKFLDDRIASIEARYDDYKLVRGFSVLLERKCQFNSAIPVDSIGEKNKSHGKDDTNDDTNDDSFSNSDSTYIKVDVDGGGQGPSVVSDRNGSLDPVTIRMALFEESSKMGFALTDFERDSIITSAASILNLSSSYIKQVMWADLEENMLLERLDLIGKDQLVGWYNLSLMQTLLFNCTRLEFSVHGGANWKKVLRNLKRLGLMYSLQEKERIIDKEHEVADKNNHKGIVDEINSSNEQVELVCSVDGPLSLFKLTDRYGTSIAKLLPSIVSTEKWSLDASTVRKTMSGKKIYQFKISSSEVPKHLWDPYNHPTSDNDQIKTGKASPPQSSLRFDSSVEEKFASKFEQSSNGWKLVREPDPLVVSDGKAFIPDFMFEKHGKKVYFEIVGFWTKEYLERKLQKIAHTISGKTVDLFVAINEKLACSKINSFSFPFIPKDRIIFYKNDSVPTRMIIDYLKMIDREIVEKELSNPNLKIKFDGKSDVISVEEIASNWKIAPETALKIAERDNTEEYLNAGQYFISRLKAKELGELIKQATRFADASSLLLKNLIPEACHADLVSKLGYDVIWENMDMSNAAIVKRK